MRAVNLIIEASRHHVLVASNRSGALVAEACRVSSDKFPAVAVVVQRELDDAPTIRRPTSPSATELRGDRVAARGGSHVVETPAARADDELGEAFRIRCAVDVELREALVLLVLRADQNVQAGAV